MFAWDINFNFLFFLFYDMHSTINKLNRICLITIVLHTYLMKDIIKMYKLIISAPICLCMSAVFSSSREVNVNEINKKKWKYANLQYIRNHPISRCKINKIRFRSIHINVHSSIQQVPANMNQLHSVQSDTN